VRSNPENLSCTKQLILLAALLFSSSAFPQTQPVNAAIDASKMGPPISKYIYGQFLEHAGDLVHEGIWAEMLADRRFYYPISSKPPEEPPAPAWRRRGPQRHWRPIGLDEFVTMDSDKPYTGNHSPLVKLDKTEPHGVMQSGLAVRNGKTYTGRIVLAGSPTASVKVALVWGKEPGDRQTITIPAIDSTYRKFLLRFVARTDSDDARLEIAGTGVDAFHVGAVSLMPADNIEGFRKEVIDALKQLHSGVYRSPAVILYPRMSGAMAWAMSTCVLLSTIRYGMPACGLASDSSAPGRPPKTRGSVRLMRERMFS